ncbi:histidine phosphatase family protein [Clostridium swellfunianum]|uniref:histidine phosphatase family protein n=1 Tax=Clostridium swellfunianum TaxID=1367462 RepID=UPI002030BFEE|nr:histidine phosphatase family protein [Clostridium swellfunianum]MCM0649083.1 histidine phosphatase family protein [Clostridium swellfunianum]
MLRLYITRHGETEWNIQKRMQGWKNSNLTNRGIRNAKALGDALKKVEFKRVYCSPLDRTRHTTELILDGRDIEVVYEENLREIHLGEIEGKNQEEANIIYPDFSTHFWEKPHLYKAKSGEDFYQVRERVLKALERIIKENPSGNVLIVTHGVILKTIHSYFKNLSMERLWDPPFIYDTSLTIVEIENGEFNIVVEGDVSHIKDIE